MPAGAEAIRGWAVGAKPECALLAGEIQFSVVEVAGQELAQLELGHGFRIAGVEARRLIE